MEPKYSALGILSILLGLVAFVDFAADGQYLEAKHSEKCGYGRMRVRLIKV
jgi:hypothetical protein